MELAGLTIHVICKGWASKPTPRSETTRLRRSVFKGFGNDEVFLNAWIVKMFNAMAPEGWESVEHTVNDVRWIEWARFIHFFLAWALKKGHRVMLQLSCTVGWVAVLMVWVCYDYFRSRTWCVRVLNWHLFSCKKNVSSKKAIFWHCWLKLIIQCLFRATLWQEKDDIFSNEMNAT